MNHTQLSVNVNKIAVLRNSRGGSIPNLLQTTLDIERFGAQGITVHPRPDGRHIRTQDVYDIAKNIKVEFNIEGYPNRDYLKLVQSVRPTQATLVPDPPQVLTSNAGWKVSAHQQMLSEVIGPLKEQGIRVSLFIDPYDYIEQDFSIIAATGADRVELYTEKYAQDYFSSQCVATTEIYRAAALKARSAGLGVNAGHDLNLANLKHFVENIPGLLEVSIGHALISDALYFGLEHTISNYLAHTKSF